MMQKTKSILSIIGIILIFFPTLSFSQMDDSLGNNKLLNIKANPKFVEFAKATSFKISDNRDSDNFSDLMFLKNVLKDKRIVMCVFWPC